ncbi:MAG: F0F1 ATP synthase subunit gamma [Anaerolineae bacterium]
MPNLEQIQGRLDNIRTVEPILGALRTISLGSWKASLNRQRELRPYAEQLRGMLPLLVPRLEPGPITRLWRRVWVKGRRRRSTTSPSRKVSVLIIGSERGLCSNFNERIFQRVQLYLVEERDDGAEVDLMVLGSRLHRLFARADLPLAWAESLPVTTIPPFGLAFDLTRRWLLQYEAGEVDAVDLIYNAYRGLGRFEPTVERLIPPEPPSATTATLPPFTIIETDPLDLYTRVVEQWTAIHFYSLLLDSTAAEHSTRYQLMEGASENAERLIEELTDDLQSLRRQSITRQMQELAVGAGLLD